MPIRYTFDEETRKIHVSIWEDLSDEIRKFDDTRSIGHAGPFVGSTDPQFPKTAECVIQDRTYYGYWVTIEKPGATLEEIQAIPCVDLDRSDCSRGYARFFTKDNPAKSLSEYSDIKLAWQKYVDERYPGWTFYEKYLAERFIERTRMFSFAFEFTKNGPRLPRTHVQELELPDGTTDIISYESQYRMHPSFYEKSRIKIKP